MHQPVERRQVERDAAVHRDGPAADAATARRGRDGHRGLVAGGEHGRDLLGRGGAHDHGGSLWHGALGGPTDGDRPPVAAGLGPGLVVEPDFGPACSSRRSRSAGGTSTTRAPRRSVTSVAVGVDRGDRSRLGHARSSPAVSSSFWHASVKRSTCSRCLGFVPTHVRGDEGGDRGGRVHRGSGPAESWPACAATARRRASRPSPPAPRTELRLRCRASPATIGSSNSGRPSASASTSLEAVP